MSYSTDLQYVSELTLEEKKNFIDVGLMEGPVTSEVFIIPKLKRGQNGK
jgi:hypothetical protein